MASGQSFVQIASPLLGGLARPISPTSFFTALHAKWGVGTLNYVQKMVQAAKMARSEWVVSGGGSAMFKKIVAAILPILASVVFFTANSGRGQEIRPTVGEDLAHNLAVSTLTPSARQLHGMRFDREQAPHPEGFYWFEITANVPDGKSPLLGYFAVNKSTGDVWDFVSCIKLTSPAIRQYQEHLRQKGNASSKTFRRSADEAPCQP
jgi:hypothetical protein